MSSRICPGWKNLLGSVDPIAAAGVERAIPLGLVTVPLYVHSSYLDRTQAYRTICPSWDLATSIRFLPVCVWTQPHLAKFHSKLARLASAYTISHHTSDGHHLSNIPNISPTLESMIYVPYMLCKYSLWYCRLSRLPTSAKSNMSLVTKYV